MICTKCGNENLDNSQFCTQCGYPINNISNDNSQQAIKKNSKIKIVSIVIAVIILITIAIGVYANNVSFFSVDDIRNSVLDNYKNETIGEAFEEYFNNYSWNSFVADSDDVVDVVEFIGYTVSNEKVIIQFSHNYSNNDYDYDQMEVSYIEINGDDFTAYQDEILSCIYSDEDFSYIYLWYYD